MACDNNSMELTWNILIKATTTIDRKNAYNKMVKIYRGSATVRRDWKHHPSERRYINRFERIRIAPKLKKQENTEKKIYPTSGGLYLLGMITIDDDDLNEHLYWIKPGRASNFKNRFRDYNTHNPHYKCFALKEISDKEEQKRLEQIAHNTMEKVGIAHCIHNDEWFLVSKEVYFDVKNNKFNYFFD